MGAATTLRAAMERLIERHAYDEGTQLCTCGKSEILGRRGHAAHVANRILFMLNGPYSSQPEDESAAVGYGAGE
jgi:hypothetical protein